MSLRKIRLELARTKEFPEGNHKCGYEFTAPLTEEGQIDLDAWKKVKDVCTVRRFWVGEDDEQGVLQRTRGGRWLFSYAPGEEDDEPIFRFDKHIFREGEYVGITEHDGVTRPFKVVSVR